ncbi:hypothetical protein K1719_022135 [Acacia pycnantha]|nr:hypothetical protein K1719_022135 [Acacia pycnantha]
MSSPPPLGFSTTTKSLPPTPSCRQRSALQCFDSLSSFQTRTKISQVTLAKNDGVVDDDTSRSGLSTIIAIETKPVNVDLLCFTISRRTR